MEQTQKRQKISELLPFIITFVMIMAWHLMIKPIVGDDVEYFNKALQGTTLVELLKYRYATWSSRIIIEIVLFGVVNHVWLWKILDVLVLASIPYMMSKILNCDKMGNWVCCFMVMVYPFNDMESAGWITTTINCLWPLWCVFVLGVLIKKVIQNQSLKWYEYLLAALAVIFASNQEQVAAVVLTVFVLAIVYKARRREWKQPFLYLGLVLNIVSFAIIMLCPGNDIRTYQEASSRMPEFFEFSLAKKVYLGIVNVERVLIATPNRVFLVIAVMLAIMTYVKTKNYWKTLIAMIPACIAIGYAVLVSTFPAPIIGKIFTVPGQITQYDTKSLTTYFPILYVLVIGISFLFSIYQLVDGNKEKFINLALLLGCGFATAVVMGFSPTIYASANRVFIYLYFILIYVCMYVFKEVSLEFDCNTISDKGKVFFSIGLIWLAANFVYVLWWCYYIGRVQMCA